MVWCGGGALWWVGKPFIVFSLAQAEQKYRFNDLILRQIVHFHESHLQVILAGEFVIN